MIIFDKIVKSTFYNSHITTCNCSLIYHLKTNHVKLFSNSAKIIKLKLISDIFENGKIKWNWYQFFQ